MKKKILFIFSLFLTCAFSLTSVSASDTILHDMNIKANIDENGNAHIQETWDMKINEGTEVYKVFNNMNESEIKDFKVKDENGLVYQNIGEWDSDASRIEKNGKCGIITTTNGYELCFGIGDYGSRVYTFEYVVTNFVKQYIQDQGLNYAFFSDMSLLPRHALITISSPYEFNKENSQIWAFGYHGDVQFIDGKVVMETSESVPENGKMQLLMRIDNGIFKNASVVDQDFDDILDDAKGNSDYNDESYSQGNTYHSFVYRENRGLGIIGIWITITAGVFIIGGLFTYALKGGKKGLVFHDRIPLKSMKEVNMFRDIPCHKDIFEFYYLAKKAGIIHDDKGGLIAAILLRWVQNGYVVFEKVEEDHLLFFKKDGFSIDLDKEIPLDHPLELQLLGFIRNAAGANKKLETKEFENWCRDHYEDIEEWFEYVERHIESKYRKNGLLKLEIVHTPFMGMNLKKDVDVYNESVREEMEHIMGLKKFLEEMSLIDEKEVIEVKLWEEYLIFASILGIADKVQDQLGRLCPTFNQQSELDTIYTMNMVHMFAYNSMRASQAAMTQAQEARSTGFGGGASFGGGGGGFSGGGGGGVR